MNGWKAIVAMAENRVIGAGNRIPWRLPDELRWFKAATMGGTLVMGRKTYESIGRPLPGRRTVVLSRSGRAFPGTTLVLSLDDLARMQGDLPKPVFITGGAEVFAEALPLCDELLLTRVRLNVEGDTRLPPFEHLFEFAEVLRETPEFVVERWRRRPAPALS